MAKQSSDWRHQEGHRGPTLCRSARDGLLGQGLSVEEQAVRVEDNDGGFVGNLTDVPYIAGSKL